VYRAFGAETVFRDLLGILKSFYAAERFVAKRARSRTFSSLRMANSREQDKKRPRHLAPA
jgi:hypothetical protein